MTSEQHSEQAGTITTWIVYRRGKLPRLGDVPPKNRSAATLPTSGIERASE